MNRRAFLSLFAVTAGAIAADPELLLWTPGAKMISIPAVTPPSKWRVHDFITIDSIWVRNPITGKAVVGLHQIFRVNQTGILVPSNLDAGVAFSRLAFQFGDVRRDRSG